MQLYRLNSDIYSTFKKNELYAKKEQLVKVISDRGNVIIVELVERKANEITETALKFCVTLDKMVKV